MSTKFLGLNSINVIKDYIDKQILTINNNGFKNITVNAYVYVKNGESVPNISGGNFDSTIPAINYPEGWNSLDFVISNIKDEEGNFIDLETALSSGAIWMSVGMINAETALSSWSTPMKISGQNGQPGQDGASFMFSYTIDGEYTSDILQLENIDGKDIIYFKYKPAGSENWSEPGIWAKHTTDGKDGINGYTTLYRYGISHIEDVDEDGNLIPPTQWVKNILNIGLSKEYPYIWMKSLSISANLVDNVLDSDFDAIEPILFSTFGSDGNTKNNLRYSDNEQEIVTIKNFIENNMFIGNSNEDMTYNIDYNVTSFASGYTGKFSNIGSGKMIITTSDNYKFVNGNVETTSFELNSQESVEIICYKTDDKNMLLVVGKQLTEQI